jgi:hypothetical protein
MRVARFCARVLVRRGIMSDLSPPLSRPVGSTRGTSASTGTRPVYRQMLADIESGTIGAVVCYHLDRLHRQPRELEDFIELADKRRVALSTVTGEVDLGTDNGRLTARITGAVAKAEVERKSARQKSAPGRSRVGRGGDRQRAGRHCWCDRCPDGHRPWRRGGRCWRV